MVLPLLRAPKDEALQKRCPTGEYTLPTSVTISGTKEASD